MEANFKIAIVILNWDGREHLENYLPHVLNNTNLNEVDIYVADNGSSDSSVEFIEHNYPEIKLVCLDKNYGFAGGYNKALQQVDADIYCILNSDVRVTKNWLKSIVQIFNSDPDVGVVQPKILSDRNNEYFEHAGAAGGFIDRFGYPFCRGRIMDFVEADNGQYNKSSDIFWASGACMFIKRDLFIENGGFDADYFAHMEEIDLCWRLKNQGHRIVYSPQSVVYHYGGATLDYENPRKLFLNFRNSLWTLYKNYSGSCLRLTMIVRMLIDTIAIAKFTVTFDFKKAATVINAHLAYYKSKPELKAKRRALMLKRTQFEHVDMLHSSIVFKYFLSGKKVFSDLKKFSHGVDS